MLRRASGSRSSGLWNDDDYDVLADGAVVGRIPKVHAAPIGSPWMWTLIFGQHEPLARLISRRIFTYVRLSRSRNSARAQRPDISSTDVRSLTFYYKRKGAAAFRLCAFLLTFLHRADRQQTKITSQKCPRFSFHITSYVEEPIRGCWG